MPEPDRPRLRAHVVFMGTLQRLVTVEVRYRRWLIDRLTTINYQMLQA